MVVMIRLFVWVVGDRTAGCLSRRRVLSLSHRPVLARVNGVRPIVFPKISEIFRIFPVFGVFLFGMGSWWRNRMEDLWASMIDIVWSLYIWVRRMKVLDVFFKIPGIFLKIIFNRQDAKGAKRNFVFARGEILFLGEEETRFLSL
jgi:hypothetical protein